jgi:hypothetical protein
MDEIYATGDYRLDRKVIDAFDAAKGRTPTYHPTSYTT